MKDFEPCNEACADLQQTDWPNLPLKSWSTTHETTWRELEIGFSNSERNILKMPFFEKNAFSLKEKRPQSEHFKYGEHLTEKTHAPKRCCLRFRQIRQCQKNRDWLRKQATVMQKLLCVYPRALRREWPPRKAALLSKTSIASD